MVDEVALVKGHWKFSTVVSDGDTGADIALLRGRSGDVLCRCLWPVSPASDGRAWPWCAPTWLAC